MICRDLLGARSRYIGLDAGKASVVLSSGDSSCVVSVSVGYPIDSDLGTFKQFIREVAGRRRNIIGATRVSPSHSRVQKMSNTAEHWQARFGSQSPDTRAAAGPRAGPGGDTPRQPTVTVSCGALQRRVWITPPGQCRRGSRGRAGRVRNSGPPGPPRRGGAARCELCRHGLPWGFRFQGFRTCRYCPGRASSSRPASF
jgi:hypothetical protein